MCRGGGGVWYLRVRAWKRFCVLNLRNHLFNELSLCSPVDRRLQEVPFGEQRLRPPVLNSLVFLSCWFVIFFLNVLERKKQVTPKMKPFDLNV